MKHLTYLDYYQMSYTDLMTLPVISEGQTDDLVAEYTEDVTNVPTRIWRTRMTPADYLDEPFYLMSIEQYITRLNAWIVTAQWNPEDNNPNE